VSWHGNGGITLFISSVNGGELTSWLGLPLWKVIVLIEVNWMIHSHSGWFNEGKNLVAQPQVSSCFFSHPDHSIAGIMTELLCFHLYSESNICKWVPSTWYRLAERLDCSLFIHWSLSFTYWTVSIISLYWFSKHISLHNSHINSIILWCNCWCIMCVMLWNKCWQGLPIQLSQTCCLY